ncbi:hypothetical protein BST22_12060 [Mycolicibacterium chubuense]|uniref:VWFA domain-containing protein n=1 Tax=Mycolicibacterium chubuense TaxID=1800 RepID=A0A0J6VPZ7_MYCCU|nr:hypothetical protein [Mycolicibacterium chubuense]KMO71513.1 hypothetical protein MCHUDSM44219_05216 [Mycolicibacterium chubuense]ORA52332.1 hypothetical protein BST22_12060 [Mycolicibacterium chubuense]SPX99659.1 Uncharacterised protein [Mycolicibacterium chubuense]
MGLMWWAVPVAGLCAAAVAIAAAVLVPDRRSAQRREPLAHTVRLTRLPEYRTVVRRQTRATAMVVLLLALLFATTLLAGARPTEPVTNAAGPRDDIMLCVGQPATDPATGRFLGYFARQTLTYGTERIGLTSADRRLVPLTRDYQFAAGRFGEYAQAGRVPNPPRLESFTSAVEYADYAPSVADVLALCLTGFPGFENPGDERRSVIYLGPGALRAPDDSRPSLFTDAQVIEMARRGAIQINAVATPGHQTDTLATMASSTGGTFVRFDPATLDTRLDAIRAHTPGDDDQRRDSPVVVLIVALALTGLLAVSLMAVRR